VSDRSGVFLLQSDESLVAMQPGEFASEDDFQRLLSRFPELLVGDQIDPEEPRRWILAKREQAISASHPGASIWSIDHVFLDQDGIPTLVELKRQSDSRIRREVVGQMLDYAANCMTYWTSDTLQEGFESTCREVGKSPDSVLNEHLRGGSPEQFWQSVQANLKNGNLRLLFVADVMPPELLRVVEYLNAQMNPTEVLAVELRQFVKDGLKTIVPTVHGHSRLAAARRSGNVRRWDEASLFEKLKQNVSEPEVELATKIFRWIEADGKRPVRYGTGKENGSVYPIFKPSGVTINPFYLSSDGKVWIQFGSLANKPVFGDIKVRRELMQRLNEIEGVSLSDVDLAKYPSIPLRTITRDPNGANKLFSALKWMDEQIMQA